MLILYLIFSQFEFDLSFLGCAAAFIITTLLFLWYRFKPQVFKNQICSFLMFHWLSLLLLALIPMSVTLFVSIFCICFRELLFRLQNEKQQNTKESLFFILSILQPLRNTQNIFLLTLILILPVELALLLKKLEFAFLDFKYLPFLLFSFCYSKQLLADVVTFKEIDAKIIKD